MYTKIHNKQMATLKMLLLFLICLSVIVSFAADSKAQDSSMPNLVGTWEGETEAVYSGGVKKMTVKLDITEQKDEHLWIKKSWKHYEPDSLPPGHIMNEPVYEAVEPQLGIIDFDGKTIYMVEESDHGIMKARLIAKDKMQFIYLEAGEHPVVYRTILVRK